MEEKCFFYVKVLKYLLMLAFLLSPYGFYVFQYVRKEDFIELNECFSWPSSTSNNNSRLYQNANLSNSKEKPCITVCCEPGEVFVQIREEGVQEFYVCAWASYNNTFNLDINMPRGRNKTAVVNVEKDFLYRSTTCKNVFYPLTALDGALIKDEWYLLADGRITNIQKSITYEFHQYCLAFIAEAGFLMPDLSDCIGYVQTFTTVLSPYLTFISASALLLSFFVYVLLPELHNLPGKCLLCLLAVLTITFYTEGLLMWIEFNYIDVSNEVCLSATRILYFLNLSSLFWTNVISFDLWKNLSSLKNQKFINQKKRLCFYAVHGYVIPLLITLLAYLIKTTPELPIGIWKSFGFDHCKLKQFTFSSGLYLMISDAFVISTNIIFFLLTARNIRNTQKELENQTSEANHQIHVRKLESGKAMFEVFLRLFLSMGVSWVSRPITYFFWSNFWIHDFFKALISSHGFFIFSLYILKPNIYMMIRKRLRQLNGTDTESAT